MSTSARFSGLSLPTDRTTGRPGGSAYLDRSASSGGPGENRPRSTPFDTDWDGARSPWARSSRSAVADGAVTRLHRLANPVT